MTRRSFLTSIAVGMAAFPMLVRALARPVDDPYRCVITPVRPGDVIRSRAYRPKDVCDRPPVGDPLDLNAVFEDLYKLKQYRKPGFDPPDYELIIRRDRHVVGMFPKAWA